MMSFEVVMSLWLLSWSSSNQGSHGFCQQPLQCFENSQSKIETEEYQPLHKETFQKSKIGSRVLRSRSTSASSMAQRLFLVLLTRWVRVRVAHAAAVFRICANIFNMRIIRTLIYAVNADVRIMRMSFPNRTCERIYQQIQAFVFQN